MSDRERDSIQEMEDIQKGLEAFLQQEMQEMQTLRATCLLRYAGSSQSSA